MILVYYSDYWADEFKVEGTAWMTLDEWESKKSKIDDKPIYSFGSNQQIYYKDKEDFLSKFWHRPIKKEEALVLKKLLKGRSYGFWPKKCFE